ncbi:MAG: hypothetical protein HY278_07410, partial [candidate division NC10 bacterium]|nr:hypothetical protein [candidate division NC10 bacterium]
MHAKRNASNRQRVIIGTLGGFVGALLMTALMFLGRFAFGTPLIPELMAERMFALIPMDLFSLGIRLFGPKAKYLAFWGMVGFFVVIGALAGAVFTWVRLRQRLMATWFGGLAYGTALWALFGLIGSPLLGGGLFGADLEGGLLLASTSLLVLFWVYGVALALVTTLLLRRTADAVKPASPSRGSVDSSRRT